MTGTGSGQRGVEGDQVKLVTDLSSFSTGHSRRERRDRRFFSSSYFYYTFFFITFDTKGGSIHWYLI